MRVTPPYEDHSVLPRPPGGSESPTTALYKAALGSLNTDYYLPVFERFDAAGRPGLVWNPAAGLLTLNWMAFRGLWGAALVYFAAAQGLALMLLGLSRHYIHWPLGVEMGVLGTLLILSIALPGLYGNALLHAEIRRRLATAVTNAHTVREACDALELQAPSRKRLQAFMGINALLVFLVLAMGSFALFGPSTAPVAGRAPAERPTAAPASAPAQAAEDPEPVSVPLAGPPPSAPQPVPLPATPPATSPAAPPVLAPLPAPVGLSAAPAPAPAPASPTAQPPAPEPVPSTQPRSAEPPRVASATAPPSRPPAAPSPHSINVGLFAEEANAAKVHAQLIGAGLPATMQTVEGPRGPRTRVRAGPFPDRPSAEAAAQRIRSLGLEAQIFRQ